MDRKEFLSAIGLTAASAVVFSCVGCSKSDNEGPSNSNNPPTGVDFTIDLTAAPNAALNNNGGFIYTNRIIVAKSMSGAFLAVAQACTHEGTSVTYNSNARLFVCPNHGAQFAENGAVNLGPATVALRRYNTSLNGTTLRVFS
ncbi:Rieske 2Fe-2S domain-containing protein [Pedobacter aquae]|uniref:Rieske 2Fe-2S domain-containing protein n=1 Tax=Pedobacter aquae TaxID=2605747 RepID=A0A5C0VJU6_9SPHI|nr:Rieske 2Fe-2S domain-containing protein [Pedobacter aquae]QEK52367.1 Rieske 2Fe-2S domain-containing protein [Pedobacter aquae]